MGVALTATCPRCGTWARMLPIVFGFPTPETFQAAERGELAIGGCIVGGEDASHACSACGHDVIVDEDPPLECIACGRPLLDDPEDDPIEGGQPLCGECNRARNFDAIEEPALFEGLLDDGSDPDDSEEEGEW